MNIRKFIAFSLVTLCVLSLSGCYETFLSSREYHSPKYSTYIYQLYEQNTEASPNKRPQLQQVQLPIRIGVAQIGEYTPSKVMLDELQKNPRLFSHIESLPTEVDRERNTYYQPEQKETPKQDSTKDIAKMIGLAQDLGVDYIFLYGGTVDISAKSNLWSVFDITIVGAYILPGYDYKAAGRASGALIDVRTQKVIFMVSAEDSLTASRATAMTSGYEDTVLDKVKTRLTKLIAKQFIDKMASL